MTRVLVLGNSHAATVRRAFDQIKGTWPDLSLEFWGLPGAAFAKARIDEAGLLRPDPEDAVSQKKAGQWNSRDHVDLAQYDIIMLVGLRYGLRPSQGFMRSLQPLDWGSRSGALGVSDGFFRAAIRAEIEAVIDAQTVRTPFDHRFILMPAPYPATTVIDAGPLHEPGPAAVTKLKRAVELHDLYEEELLAAHRDRGLSLALQPRDTLAGAFLTQPIFLEDPGRDARHMNSDYGLIAFGAMARLIPDLLPAKTGQRFA